MVCESSFQGEFLCGAVVCLLLGVAPHPFLTHLLCCAGKLLHSPRQEASQVQKHTHAQPQVSHIARRPPHHSGCAVQVVTTSEKSVMQPPRGVTTGQGEPRAVVRAAVR